MFIKLIKIFFLIGILTFDNKIALAQHKLGIKDVILSAKKNNPDLKTQRFDIKKSEAKIITAKLRLNPQLQTMNLLIPSKSQRPSNNSLFSFSNTQPWIQVGAPIRIAPKRKLWINVTTYNWNDTKTIIEEKERNTSFQVANQWLAIWLESVNLELINNAKLNMDTLVEKTEKRVKNKEVEESDLLRIQILSEKYSLMQKVSQQNLSDELNDLKVLIGRDDSINIDVNDPFVPIIINNKLDSLINYALTNRSDIKSARKQIEAAKANYKLQRSFRYPDPFIGGIYNPQNGINYFGYYLNVVIPIFQRNQGEIQFAKVTENQSESYLTSTTIKIKTEVTIAYQQYTVRKKNLDRYSRISVKANTVLHLIRDSYLSGKTNIVDYLSAQDTWYEAKKLYFDSMNKFRESYIDLITSTGMINEIN